MINKDLDFDNIRCDRQSVKEFHINLIYFEKVLIKTNPVYDWFADNANDISYKLVKAFITNIIPLGYQGKKYFEKIVNKKRGIAVELWRLYNKLEMEYSLGNLEIATYSELISLGYRGSHLGGNCPVDDILKFIGKETIRTSEAFRNQG